MKDLVSCQWLFKNRKQENIRVFDASFYVPGSPKSAKEEFDLHHISGSHFFDIDKAADPNSPLPHMIPDQSTFEKYVSELGIKQKDHVIFYDQMGIVSSARAWWLFKVFGHDNVSVLDGGLFNWLRLKYETTTEVTPIKKTTYKSKLLRPRYYCHKSEVEENIDHASSHIIDARDKLRFLGLKKEIWPNRRSGHIPTSINIPFTDLLDKKTKTLHSHETLKKIFLKHKIDLNKRIITTCGSGVTACVILLALFLINKYDISLYDGSWAEWGLDQPSVKTA